VYYIIFFSSQLVDTHVESAMQSVGTLSGLSRPDGSHDTNPNPVRCVPVLGLLVFTTIIKPTSNTVHECKHPVGHGKYYILVHLSLLYGVCKAAQR
jgi:hypothetical protein